MIHIQSQTFLNPMLMTEAPYNPYIHPYHAGPLHFHFPLQPAFSTMGNGFPVQNIAHYRQPHVFPAHQYTAHMGPSVYPRKMADPAGGSPYSKGGTHTPHSHYSLCYQRDKNLTRQCPQGRPAPVVHPAPKHTADAHKPSPIEGKHQVVYPEDGSQDCSIKLSRDSPQSPDVELFARHLAQLLTH